MPALPPQLAFRRLLPNILTLLALASGLTALRYTFNESYEKTIIALLAAGFFDILDGRVARMLGTPSKFGAELDSLSDAICFGVVPAMTLYLWTLHGGGTMGWLAVLCFVMCCVLRLARFNVAAEEPPPAFAKKFFTGIPTPAGAACALAPFVAAIQWPALGIVDERTLISLWVIIVGFLMVSRVPTFALKGWQVPRGIVIPLLLGVVALAAGLVTDTWITLLIAVGLYVLSIPVAAIYYRRQRKTYA
jgi:CDP-diacylglycerol--serine O-phosphatidyltransferase